MTSTPLPMPVALRLTPVSNATPTSGAEVRTYLRRLGVVTRALEAWLARRTLDGTVTGLVDDRLPEPEQRRVRDARALLLTLQSRVDPPVDVDGLLLPTLIALAIDPGADALAAPDDVWVPEDANAVAPEGWNLFECGGFQIQRDDEANLIPGDGEAWALVIRHARGGSLLHLAAVAAVALTNPTELVTIAAALADYPRWPDQVSALVARTAVAT